MGGYGHVWEIGDLMVNRVARSALLPEYLSKSGHQNKMTHFSGYSMKESDAHPHQDQLCYL